MRLAWAYVRHLARRRFRSPAPGTADEVLTTYSHDRLRPLTAAERERLPAMSRCINCGLCALVVRRLGEARMPDLANTYLRDYTQLPIARADLVGAEARAHVLAAAAAVCPTGVPLDEVAEAVRRLAAKNG